MGQSTGAGPCRHDRLFFLHPTTVFAWSSVRDRDLIRSCKVFASRMAQPFQVVFLLRLFSSESLYLSAAGGPFWSYQTENNSFARSESRRPEVRHLAIYRSEPVPLDLLGDESNLHLLDGILSRPIRTGLHRKWLVGPNLAVCFDQRSVRSIRRTAVTRSFFSLGDNGDVCCIGAPERDTRRPDGRNGPRQSIDSTASHSSSLWIMSSSCWRWLLGTPEPRRHSFLPTFFSTCSGLFRAVRRQPNILCRFT